MKKSIEKLINDARLASIRRVMKEVLSYAEHYQQLSDDALQSMTGQLKQRYQKGESLEQLLPESYALVREASLRVLNMYPKEVQIMGAIVLHQGNIAEMQTGEGKTLTATMPLYLNALTGHSAYLITTNDYLARRDFEEMQPLYEWLGLKASLGFIDIPGYEYKKGEKKKLYDADIIYSTNGRVGFDYLIDNLADQLDGKFQKALNYCIIDEVDSIILDVAQTPLVISGAPRVQSNLFNVVKEFIDTLEENIDFHLNKNANEIYVLQPGRLKASTYFNVENLYTADLTPLVRTINLALRAKYLFEKNIDYYIVDGEIVLIDQISGRLLPGTKLQAGLHQSIEAKERLKISDDMSVLATITFQNLFKQFTGLAGMSATSKLGEQEFYELYGKVVVQIPTAHPVRRIDKPDRVFLTKQHKLDAILQTIEEIHATARPVLLITRTADDAEYFSKQLLQRNIPNNLLIAQNVAKEAQMIAEAGHLQSVTVATSMAGRGTDIKLEAGVVELGGLAVIIAEHMENSRIDRQLRGRAGRQGDPGSSQIYISLEDYLVKRWSNSKLVERKDLKQLNSEQIEDSRLMKRRIAKIVANAQIVSEEHGMLNRQMNNEFARSVSIQRQLIYDERNKILEADNVDNFNFRQLAHDTFSTYINEERPTDERDLKQYIYKHISFQFAGEIPHVLFNDTSQLIDYLTECFMQVMEEKKKRFKNQFFYTQFLQRTLLKAIDQSWIQQVDYLQQMRLSIRNRQMGRRNAIFEYHRTALESYHAMDKEIKKNMIRNLALSMTTTDKKGNLVIHFP